MRDPDTCYREDNFKRNFKQIGARLWTSITLSRRNVTDMAVVSHCTNDGEYLDTVRHYRFIKKCVFSWPDYMCEMKHALL